MKDFIKVNKRTLLLIAGLVWGFAGFRVFTIGIGDVESHHGSFIYSIIFAAIIFFVFFKFIFSKMFKKHTTRIINSELKKHCAFSFFDVRSYLIMGFMIFFGITVRSIGIFNPVYVGTFYIGLGFALFMAGVLFLISSFKFSSTNLKFKM
ncbi:hypothetical protein [Clostridium sp.]|mgnify:CR=1 FL=1|uniref:hypothetical protein n=1 Tax=Clostridium sp. TaxID=1506 RepID=UPI0026DBDDCD|nr:hypothetical protein [Clostridium sp.]MDO5039335.1 hypothetical protein [Clostridium sp.]